MDTSDTTRPAMLRMTQDAFGRTLREHAVWLSSGGREGRRANLRELDLTACELAGANLERASLRGARLEGMNLSRTNLRDADLGQADCRRIVAEHAILEGADLMQASFAGASLTSCLCDRVDASAAAFVSADLRHSSFQEAAFREAAFDGANLSGARLEFAVCRGASFSQANLTGAWLDHADCRDSVFHRTVLAGTSLDRTSFRGATFQDIDFTEADCSRVVELDLAYQQEIQDQHRLKLEKDREKLIEKEAALTQAEQDARQQARILQRLIDQDGALLDQMARFGAKARSLAMVWFLVIVMSSAAAALLFVQAAHETGNSLEIVVIFGLSLGVLILYLVTALIPSRLSRVVEAHTALRKSKLSSPYTDTMPPSETGPESPPVKGPRSVL